MSFDITWDIKKYREEHECEDHWTLRKAFMERWKTNYPEQRLVCLARVFSNIEVLGCTYPEELMNEIATLSEDIAESYRSEKKNKLQRSCVSASEAAGERARGIKRVRDVLVNDEHLTKLTRINFVKPGASHVADTNTTPMDLDLEGDGEGSQLSIENTQDKQKNEKCSSDSVAANEYLSELQQLNCVDVRRFTENMFYTCYGKVVLLIRPWTGKLSNIKSSFQACHIPLESKFENGVFSIIVNGQVLAQSEGIKVEAKAALEALAWERMKSQVISVLVKEQWIAHSTSHVSLSDVAGKGRVDNTFGTPIESSVASKMMQMMGWKGGGLGAESQGIAEPIRPHLQMVNRAGLGSTSSDIRQVKRAAQELMQRYMYTSPLDVDLVFSSDFSKEERAALHQTASKCGLASKSYGSNEDRFLVVKKKLDPFSIVKAVIHEGGNTAKYQVFIPVALSRNN